MDKNKNSSDLLAAGHKKLKQFRPEKDGKGSSSQGNSSKKTNKSEQHESDADAADTVAKPTALLHVSEGETTGGDLTVSRSTESSLPSGLADAAFISPVEPIVSEETGNTTTVAAHDAGLPIEVGTVGECDVNFSVPNGGQSTQTFDSMTSIEIPSSTADIPVFEGETRHDDVPHSSASVDTKEGTVVKLDLAFDKKEMGKNSLLTMDDFPNIYLSQAREDQITDVGAMQETGGLGMNQLDRGSETKFGVDGRLPLSRTNELQISLARSQEDLTSLLSELAEYKNQVATLQADNESLNKTLYSLTDDRNRLTQEKESSLNENKKTVNGVSQIQGFGGHFASG